MSTKVRATIEDLLREEGKAELVDGEIVRFMATGGKEGRASGNIYMRLRQHESPKLPGYAIGDTVGFIAGLADAG